MRHCRTQNKSIKQFTTIEIACRYTDNSGLPLSLAGMTISSDVHSSSGRFVDSLNVNIVNEAQGEFVLTPTLEKLPADILSIDVLFEKDGKRISSDTFTIEVEAAITNPIGV